LAAWPAGVAWDSMTAFAVGPAWSGADSTQRQALSQLFPEVVVAAQRGAFKLLRQDAELVLQDYGFPAVNLRRDFFCRQLNVSPCVPMALKLGVRGAPPGSGELIYEVIEVGGAWRIVDFQIAGISLLDTYQQQFAAEIRITGLNGLIAQLRRRQR
jgi:ABC-type transporter MlaC component